MWMLRYAYWLSPPSEESSSPRQLGKRIHEALEASFKSGGQWPPSLMASQLYEADMLADPLNSDTIRKEKDLAVTMLLGYEQWAAETGLDEDVDVIAAESDVQVALPGVPGVIIRGRLDQQIRRKSDGVVLFRDWKTVGSLGQSASLVLSPQMRFYAMLQRLAATEDDARVDGGQVVYLLRSKRTARATPPFYQLSEVRYNRHDLNAMYMRTKAAVTEILAARAALAAGTDHHEACYPSPMDSCSWGCPFRDMCPLMDDGSAWRDMARYEFMQESPYSYYDQRTTTA